MLSPLSILNPSFSHPLPCFLSFSTGHTMKTGISGHLMDLLNHVLCLSIDLQMTECVTGPVGIGASRRARARASFVVHGNSPAIQGRGGGDMRAKPHCCHHCSDLRASAESQIPLTTCFCMAYDSGKAFPFFKK